MNKFANIAFVTLSLLGVASAAQAADGLAQYAQRAVAPVPQSNIAPSTQQQGMVPYAFHAITPNGLNTTTATSTAQIKGTVTSAKGYAVYAQRAVMPVL